MEDGCESVSGIAVPGIQSYETPTGHCMDGVAIPADIRKYASQTLHVAWARVGRPLNSEQKQDFISVVMQYITSYRRTRYMLAPKLAKTRNKMCHSTINPCP